MNMLRLWLPQIFQIIRDYQLAHDGGSASLCTMLETVSSPNKTIEDCIVVSTRYLITFEVIYFISIMNIYVFLLCISTS